MLTVDFPLNHDKKWLRCGTGAAVLELSHIDSYIYPQAV